MNYDPIALDLIAHQVLNCVCAELDRVAADAVDLGVPGCPCRTGVVPGTVAWDACCGDCGTSSDVHGQLTVSMGAVFPTARFPIADSTLDVCQPATLAATYVITLLRCAPTLDNKGNPPTVDALNVAARVMHTDMLTMQHAAACCITRTETGKKRRVAVTGHRPVGPGGGCVGSELTVVIDTKLMCCPQEAS